MGKNYIPLNRNLICPCGTKSQRWGKCWEKGLCCKCAEKKALTCQCGATSNHTNAECWRNGMCVKCYNRFKHPKKESQYTLCPNCKERMMSVRYQKNGISVKMPVMICTICSEIFIFPNKYHISWMKLRQ